MSAFLSAAPKGASFTVLSVILDREVGRRLADMGFTAGTEGTVIRAGFLRGPIQVRIRGYDLLLRRCEAAGIAVAPGEGWDAPVQAECPRGRRIRRGPGRRGSA